MANLVPSNDAEQAFLPQIRRARIETVDIFEVSELELGILGRESPESVYLNFAIFLLSVAIAFTIALLTTTAASVAVLIFFTTCTIVGFVGGALLGILWFRSWFRNRKSISECISTIRKRLPSKTIETPLSDIGDNEKVLVQQINETNRLPVRFSHTLDQRGSTLTRRPYRSRRQVKPRVGTDIAS